jgi:hypothetical protein
MMSDNIGTVVELAVDFPLHVQLLRPRLVRGEK